MQPRFRAWHKQDKLMMRVGELHWSVAQQDELSLVWAGRMTDGLGYDMLPSEVELMQFTGLCDKDGRDIYEGDIVRITWKAGYNDSRSAIGVVIFTDGAFCIEGQFGNYYCWTAYEVEVLGNIYENPSLLEQIRNSDGPK